MNNENIKLCKESIKLGKESPKYCSEDIKLRNENSSDYKIVEELTREAFWNHYVPGCDEHYLMHIIRDSEAFIKELDFVAEADGKIIGNIVYTKAKIVADDGTSQEVLSFGPLSVLPEFQGKGIGGMLVEHTKTIAKELAPYGIRVNSIAPGLTDTGMAGQMEDKAWHEMVGKTNMNRLGKPEEIARVMVWLASDASTFITGQIIRVDGGM